MRYFLRFLFLLILTFVVLGLHFFFVYMLPFPYDKINVLFLYLIFYLLFTESGTVVWLCFLTHILIEIFPSTSFGVTLLSSCLSILMGYWISLYYVTSRRWYGAVLLLFFTLFLYRMLFAIFTFFLQRVQTDSSPILWSQLLSFAFWESILTCAGFLVVYFLFYKFSRRFHSLVTQ